MKSIADKFKEAFTKTCKYCYSAKIKHKGNDGGRAWKEGICDECRVKHPVRKMECRKCNELFTFRWIEGRNGELRPKLLCPKCSKIEWERFCETCKKARSVEYLKPLVVKRKAGEIGEIKLIGPEPPLFRINFTTKKNQNTSEKEPFDEQNLDRACLGGLLKNPEE